MHFTMTPQSQCWLGEKRGEKGTFYFSAELRRRRTTLSVSNALTFLKSRGSMSACPVLNDASFSAFPGTIGIPGRSRLRE
mgnify:CR=1 FL=1